jgi:hypothetical protein
LYLAADRNGLKIAGVGKANIRTWLVEVATLLKLDPSLGASPRLR